MRMFSMLLAGTLLSTSDPLLAQTNDTTTPARSAALSELKVEATRRVDGLQKLTQEIVDSLFSFSELGFQEFETQRYLTKILEERGFRIERAISGIPSAWWATWGKGSPVIALGSDIDGLPKTSQMPGVAYRQPLIAGGPGHGEGHNSGQAVNIAAALAVKAIMEREKIPGTLVLWPGVAEEVLGAKPWFVRDGRFKGVDAVLFTHVGSNLNVGWGRPRGTGLVSVEYSFQGVSAHSAESPWKGHSALDAVELMNVGWNFRREHLSPLQRSHYVIVDGGDQPNVVPSQATVWYFVRELTAESIRANFATLTRIADAAAMMTDTTMQRRIIGAAWPRHFNKPMALAMGENIRAIGMPSWSNDDQRFAKAVQRLMGSPETGLVTAPEGVMAPPPEPVSGVSDDIGDVAWNVPTVTLHYPSNIGGLVGHHWSSTIAMATPIAHKGAAAGAKVIATTVLDLLQTTSLREEAWKYFQEEQLKGTTYEPFIGPDDRAVVTKNSEIMAEFKDRLKPLRYDPSRHATYLEQLGIKYPQLEPPSAQP